MCPTLPSAHPPPPPPPTPGPAGYQNMVQYLAKGIDVRLNTKVVKVDASRADRITLTTAAGGTFTARRVIVTVPLGVLQHKVITFVPPLPAVNQKAINTLGMGLLNKLTLVFPRVFWTDDAKVEVINRVAPLGDGAWEETYNMYPITGVPMLVAFNAADYAWGLEKLSDAAVLAQYMAVLRAQWGSSVPDPVSVSGGRGGAVGRSPGWWVGRRLVASRPALGACLCLLQCGCLSGARQTLPPSPRRRCPCTACCTPPSLLQYAVTSWGKDPFAFGSYSYTKRPTNGYDGYTSAHRE